MTLAANPNRTVFGANLRLELSINLRVRGLHPAGRRPFSDHNQRGDYQCLKERMTWAARK